jgi:hypothetical protein
MRIDRNAAPIVADAEKARRLVADIDEAGVTGDRLNHRIVEGFREKMMDRGLAGAADIHARPPPDRLQPLQLLDRGGGIAQFAKRFVVGVRLAAFCDATEKRGSARLRVREWRI